MLNEHSPHMFHIVLLQIVNRVRYIPSKINIIKIGKYLT